ncbi:HTTM domain-containing protein [Streptomyces sp. NPDC088729]|uniref:HTTM domain-containing protein n=1 Tax=Streptomyces sp. NPDC088729 TaxID=3365876 RepID=UPI00380D7D5A
MAETAPMADTANDPIRPVAAAAGGAATEDRRPASLLDAALGRLTGTARHAWSLLTERPLCLYAVSVLRIGYGLLYLVFLLREFPNRDVIWGHGSPWTPDLARQLFDQTGWASVLTLSDSRVHFELCYAAALVVSFLFLLGWRTRAVSVLFAVVVASFHARSIFMTDGGDNLVLLMALYLVLTASGRRWSLDAGRARRDSGANSAGRRPPLRIPARLRAARATLVTAVHNCGLLVIALQVCFLYGAAGLYKVQGGTWGAGTALHYVMNLELFQPWPALSHWVDDQALAIAVAGYLTVLLQVAFPFVLFGRLKYPVLTMLFGMHIGIAVLMGLPLFSGAMIIADAVFLPDRFYIAVGGLARRALRRPGAPRAAAGEPGARRGTVPKQHGRPTSLVRGRP